DAKTPNCHPRESGDLRFLSDDHQTGVPAFAGMTLWERELPAPPKPLRSIAPSPLRGEGWGEGAFPPHHSSLPPQSPCHPRESGDLRFPSSAAKTGFPLPRE